MIQRFYLQTSCSTFRRKNREREREREQKKEEKREKKKGGKNEESRGKGRISSSQFTSRPITRRPASLSAGNPGNNETSVAVFKMH